ncbi:hypothetical protein COU87_03605 [Candidatus Roizmanbacteria bacterium CG10_big_fil_rev_8_21_14_0_10_39_12]|uniref:Tyrosine specific protein phosphatases domain-containing protein n=1 Tax=Candidatus Roizmanbacteria bacterium CG10_big_fil_rev_8_21_14_0_10_39_12 TaxID=1974852 RepID=A0A2M8KNY8_9BACT|nr:MAG: hypothetical protein COU87_03605 [Candidatus Roizmanbacteria bacterium CG10_big_fil_rev_8_21_14_0_10_39_12]
MQTFLLKKRRLMRLLVYRFYIWIPIRNHTAPTSEQLNFGVVTIKKLVGMKKKMYVHCQNGHGRAPTMIAAYLIKEGKSADEALKFIKEKRPTIHLDDVQKEALEKFANEKNQSCCV